MRRLTALLMIVFASGPWTRAFAQSCTGLCLQQVTCPNGGTTTVSGVVYAPNGTDPLPNVTVYIPNAPVAAFTPGVSCDVVGAPPSGSPLVGATSAVDGTFTLGDVPVGTNIPLVIVSGRWRRQLVIPATTSCVNTALPSTFAVMPQNQTQGDIPKIAIATGAVDQVECILRKVGIADTEFTNPSGSGRINLYTGSGGPGARIDSSTPTQAALMENASTLNSYDLLMLPCQGTPNNNVVSGALGTQELANFISFANAGGRIYSSHYSYAWMYQNPPFDGVANWTVNSGSYPDGTATVNTGFTAGQTLSTWLQDVGASTTAGQIGISTLKHDLNGVIAPTQSWLTLNTTGNPVMQFVFDTPIAPTGTTVNQCGRVLYNEYHVENGSSSPTEAFPAECSSGTTMSPQEKLLEYMLFELTDEGGQPSLAPTAQDFGSQAVGFTSAPQTFTWTNNSSFPSAVTSSTVTGDFRITSNNCSSVAAGASCTITVVFTPTALGARTGALTVVSSGNTLMSTLTGTGTPGFSLSASTLTFGNLDVGATSSQTLTLTSLATGPLAVPAFTTTGPYSVSTAACGATVAALSSCLITVTFHPTVTGVQAGTLAASSSALVYSGLTATMTGNGVDFSLSLSPTSGTVVAGDAASTTATLTPISGFSANVALSCAATSNVAGSNCGLTATSELLSSTLTAGISISTTSQYTVVGYGGLGGRYLWLLGAASGWLLWTRRRRVGGSLRPGMLALLLAAAGLAMCLSATGCSGKLPAQNSVYTGPGTYTIGVTATDGFLVRSATYTLTVTSK
jgi:hypothetical protein